MVVLGSHRYFELKEKDLRIASANPFAVQNISISNISKVEVSYLAIRIFSTELPNGQVYHMRKWPKKYFINHLAVHSHFVGEIILVDHLIKQDYFEEYYAKKPNQSREMALVGQDLIAVRMSGLGGDSFVNVTDSSERMTIPSSS